MSSSRAPAIADCIAAISRRSYTTRSFPRPRQYASQFRRQQDVHLQQTRHLTVGNNFRKAFRTNPISVSLAGIIILCSAGLLVAVNYKYSKTLALHNYPEPVAKKLRRAMYYSNMDLNPEQAVRYYKEAIVVAEEVQMDCWSDEVIGIKLAVAALMEKLEQYSKQITALEVIRRDCLVKMEEFAQQPERKQDRTRLLKWATSISIKLGELYSLPEVWNREGAEKNLSWAVDTMIRERQRRNSRKITDEQEGPWISNEELAAAVEGMAQTYEAKDLHYLAAPLFLHAINLHPVQTCHTVVLMNNLASSLSQQSPRAAAAAQAHADSQSIVHGSSAVPVSREMLLQMAQTWAQNALTLASEIAPPNRTEECDVACAVTTHNLGEFAEITKNFDEAKRRYREAISLSRAIGFQDGIENSSARLRKLENST